MARKRPPRDLVRDIVLDVLEQTWDLEDIEDILAVDPKEFDDDPAPFYETLETIFGIDDIEWTTILETIAIVGERWDRKLRPHPVYDIRRWKARLTIAP